MREYKQEKTSVKNIENPDKYRYHVQTNSGHSEEIDFVPLPKNEAEKTDESLKAHSDTSNMRKTNPQIISQYLVLDPTVTNGENSKNSSEQVADIVEFVPLAKNEGVITQEHAQILSNRIEMQKLDRNLDLASHKDWANSSLSFIPVRMVTKTRKMTGPGKNKDKKTSRDMADILKTKILVSNEGLQTRIKKWKKMNKKKEFRRSSGIHNLLNKHHFEYILPGEKNRNNDISGNLSSLSKKQLYKHILQSYNKEQKRKQLRRRKRKLRKKKHAKRKRKQAISANIFTLFEIFRASQLSGI